MTVAELAKELGCSHQAIYKKIAKAGLKMADLREASTGQLTAQGVEAIRNLYSNRCTRNAQQDAQEVERLRNEVAKLRQEAAAATQRAEIAETKAASAENERDYLRQLLDSAIKANALASMKRLQAPEEQKTAVVSQQLHTLIDRIKAAWGVIREK